MENLACEQFHRFHHRAMTVLWELWCECLMITFCSSEPSFCGHAAMKSHHARVLIDGSHNVILAWSWAIGNCLYVNLRILSQNLESHLWRQLPQFQCLSLFRHSQLPHLPWGITPNGPLQEADFQHGNCVLSVFSRQLLEPVEIPLRWLGISMFPIC